MRRGVLLGAIVLMAVFGGAFLAGNGEEALRAAEDGQPEAGQEITIIVLHAPDGGAFVTAGAGHYQVSLDGDTRTTNGAGKVQFGGRPPGVHGLTVSKRASAPPGLVSLDASPCGFSGAGGASISLTVTVEGGQGPHNPECTVRFAQKVFVVQPRPDEFSTRVSTMLQELSEDLLDLGVDSPTLGINTLSYPRQARLREKASASADYSSTAEVKLTGATATARLIVAPPGEAASLILKPSHEVARPEAGGLADR